MRALVVAAVAILLAACSASPTPSPSGSPGGPSGSALGSPSASARPASTSNVTPVPATTSPADTPTAAGGTWTGLRWEAPALTEPYEILADVVAWAGGYVAVGQFQNTKGGLQAAAWVSTDWHTWARTFLAVPPAGDSAFWRVLPLGSGLVAVGTSGVQHCVPPAGEGQVCDPLPIGLWTSADGRAWQQVPTPAGLAGAAIADMAAGAGGIVAVGDTGWNRPGIWTSADGVAWHRESLPAKVFAKAHLVGIADAHGSWVLTGFTGGTKPVCCVSSPGATIPAAWFSADGLSWKAARVNGAKAATGDQISRVFVGSDGLVARGGHSNSYGWISPDGQHWSARPKPDGYIVWPDASDGNRIIGDSYVDGDRQAFWVSTSGATWQPLAAAGAADQMPVWSMPGATADAEFLFPDALGLVGGNNTERGLLWLAGAVTGP